jgi:hypothetical protein
MNIIILILCLLTYDSILFSANPRPHSIPIRDPGGYRQGVIWPSDPSSRSPLRGSGGDQDHSQQEAVPPPGAGGSPGARPPPTERQRPVAQRHTHVRLFLFQKSSVY